MGSILVRLFTGIVYIVANFGGEEGGRVTTCQLRKIYIYKRDVNKGFVQNKILLRLQWKNLEGCIKYHFF